MMDDHCSSELNEEQLDFINKNTSEIKLELKLDVDKGIELHKTEEYYNENIKEKDKVSSNYTSRKTENDKANGNETTDSKINASETSKQTNIEVSKDFFKTSSSHSESSIVIKEASIETFSDSESGPSSFVPARPRILVVGSRYGLRETEPGPPLRDVSSLSRPSTVPVGRKGSGESSFVFKEASIETLSDSESGPSSFVPPRMLMSACSMTTSYNSDEDDDLSMSHSQYSEDLSSGKFEYDEVNFLEKQKELHSFLEDPREINLEEDYTDKIQLLKENKFEKQKRDTESIDLSEEGKKKKRRRKKNKNKVESPTEEVKKINIRPNYFVGIQISNPKIHEAIVRVQEDLLLSESNIYRALVDVATAHITLLVAHLPDESAVAAASSTLEQFGEELSEKLTKEPLCLSFTGLSHFSNQTLYVKIVEDSGHQLLMNLAGRLREIFDKRGVCMPDKKVLHPHLTIAKLSKAPRGKGKLGLRKIDASSYESHIEKHFGSQIINGIQLLSMNKPKDEHRYFYNSKNFPLDVVSNESVDHSGCCFPRRPVIENIKRTVEMQQLKRKLSTSSHEIERNSSNESEWITRAAKLMAIGVALLTAAILIPRISKT